MLNFNRSVWCILYLCLTIEIANASLKTIKIENDTKYGLLQVEIHFDEKDLKLAERAEEIAKTDLIKVIEYFEHAPIDTVHINIDQKMRLTNGNATNFPTNIINLYNFPPNNNEHLIVIEDWWRGLILHEFTHIVHLDQTRGVLEGGRKVFGNVAKIPVGVVPRWFTEGIAVWSESNLYKSGRLNNSLFNKELWIYLNDKKNCTKIECIDTPGIYPSGQLAYWMGSAFINYLENIKPKTIKCLVEENSYEIPFFLDRVFTTCTGLSVYQQFENFKIDYLKKYSFENKVENSDDHITNIFGSTDYQKGFILDGTRVYQVERNRKIETLVYYDLEAKLNMSQKYSHPISDLAGVVQIDNETRALLVSFNTDPRFKLMNKEWKLINADTLIEERTLNFDQDPSYVIPVGKDDYETFTYLENRWHYKRVRFEEMGKNILSEFVFPSSDNLVFAQVIGKNLVYKVYNYPTDTSKLIISDLNLSGSKQIYASKNYFEIFGIRNNRLLMSEKDKYFSISFEEDKIFKQELSKENYLNTSQTVSNDKYKINLDESLKSKAAEADVMIGPKEEIIPSEVVYEIKEDRVLKLNSYPEIELFKPHYWFVTFGNSDNVSSFGAMTSFSDPMNIHNFNLSSLYYSQIAKLGGNLDYTFDTNPYLFQASFNQEYTSNSLDSKFINRTKNFNLNLKYIIEKRRLTLVPSAFFGIDSTNDFISDRKTNYIGARGAATFVANSPNDFINTISLTSRLAIDSPNLGDSFTNWQNKFDSWYNLSENLQANFQFNAGKLFKTDFSRGVLYAGGINTLSTVRWFEFYGIPYGNAYGNDLITTRFKLDLNVLNIYSGHNLFPFYLKELHGIIGLQTLKTDRIFLENRLYRDESVSSFFFGTKLMTNLFYLAPVNFELIFSTISIPTGGSVNQANLSINAELF